MATSLELFPFRKIKPRMLDWVGKLLRARNCDAVFSATREDGRRRRSSPRPLATWHESAWCAVRGGNFVRGSRSVHQADVPRASARKPR
jgi:hypothetical protein